MLYPQISYWAFRDGPSGERGIVETMRLAKEAGFKGIELAIGERGQLTPDTPANECRNIAAAAKAIGIQIGSVASGLGWQVNAASRKKEEREQALEIVSKCLRVTADLGAAHLLVLPGHVDVFFLPQSEPVPYADCYKRSIAFLQSVGKQAAKRKVIACVENVWNRFLYSPLEFKAFLKAVGHKNVRMYFDVGNVWNYGYPRDWIEILGKQIARVHIKDFRRAVGNVNGFCKLGEGDVPLKESLKLLKKAGYNGPVTAEVSPGREDTNEMVFLLQTAEAMKTVWP
jgi:hexulose-6-phosphate isomerase